MSLGAGGFGSGPVSVTKAQLPEVLFAACSEGLKPGALEVRCKVWKGDGGAVDECGWPGIVKILLIYFLCS